MGKVKALELKIENPNRMNGFGIGLFCFVFLSLCLIFMAKLGT
jgi:hypothetical protein